MTTFTAHSEPADPPLLTWHCAACGATMHGDQAVLPDVCPNCRQLTTWLDHPPKRITWRNTHGVAIHSDHPVQGVRCYTVRP